MKLSFATLIVVVSIAKIETAIDGQKIPACGEAGFDHFDKLMSKRMMFWDERKLPVNRPEMDVYCRENRNLDVTIKKYGTTCGKGIMKPILSIMVLSTSRTNRLYCNNPRRSEELIGAGQCVNLNKKKLKNCMNTMVKTIYEARAVDDRDKLPMICCTQSVLAECSVRVLADSGKSACSESHVRTVEGYIDKVTIDQLKTFCGEYTEEGSDKCDRLKESKRVKSKLGNSRNNTNHVIWRTPLIPMIELLSSIAEA